MSSKIHEVRDPIHAFVRLDSDERILVNGETKPKKKKPVSGKQQKK